jgi:hypothetical protein
MNDGNRVYLGDGAYAKYDCFGIELTTENGVHVTNTIYLEPKVLLAMLEFIKIKIPEILP